MDLSQVKGGLQGEIAMLRVSIRWVFERATELRDGSLKLSIPGSASYEKNSVLSRVESSRKPAMSLVGALPKKRLYSLLNYEAL